MPPKYGRRGAKIAKVAYLPIITMVLMADTS